MNRFWDKVKRRGPDKCWNWTGANTGNGYGQFWWNGRNQRAHRVSYALSGRTLDPDLQVCHTCDNGMCVNPAHLFQGTAAENVWDAVKKGRRNDVRLTPEDAKAIRRDYVRREVPMSKLALRFGVSTTTISRIIDRTTYDWLTE